MLLQAFQALHQHRPGVCSSADLPDMHLWLVGVHDFLQVVLLLC